MELLRVIMTLVHEEGYRVGNVDCTVVTEVPQMAPHINKIRKSLSVFLNIEENSVSVKATRTENVLFSATDGLLAMATVLVYKI